MSNIYTFDIGNNNPHVGHFVNGELINIFELNDFLSNQQELPEDSKIACSIVGIISEELQTFFSNHSQKIIPIEKWRGPKNFREMPINYSETLGQDRLYQCYFLYKTESEIIRNYNIVLVDAGTFTTIDIISSDGLAGGFIMPGNQTYLDLFSKGKLLPSLGATQLESAPELNPHQLPNTTELAIMQGLLLLMTGTYQYIDQNLADNRLCFIATGGHGKTHWKAIRSLNNSVNLLLPYRHDIIHHSLRYLVELYLHENKNETEKNEELDKNSTSGLEK